MFSDVTVSSDQTSVYVGTTGGEVMVFRRGANVFRVCIPVCTKGVSSLTVIPRSGNIVCGGGDGTIHILEGSDMGWRVQAKVLCYYIYTISPYYILPVSYIGAS